MHQQKIRERTRAIATTPALCDTDTRAPSLAPTCSEAGCTRIAACSTHLPLTDTFQTDESVGSERPRLDEKAQPVLLFASLATVLEMTQVLFGANRSQQCGSPTFRYSARPL